MIQDEVLTKKLKKGDIVKANKPMLVPRTGGTHVSIEKGDLVFVDESGSDIPWALSPVHNGRMVIDAKWWDKVGEIE